MKADLLNDIIKLNVEDKFVCRIAERMVIDLKREQESHRGKNFGAYSHDDIAAGLIYLAYRKAKTPKSLVEIAYLMNMESAGRLGQIAKTIMHHLGMKYCQPANASLTGACMLIPQPENFVDNIIKVLALSDKTKTNSYKIIKRQKDTLSGNNPVSIAAGAVYVAALLNDEKKHQRNVAVAAGITEVTMRNLLRKIYERETGKKFKLNRRKNSK